MASTRVAGIDGEQLASLRGDLRIAASAIPADDLQSARGSFLALLERPQSVGFSIGWIDSFVQLGPALLDDRLVMLPSCVTNVSATSRGSDYLSPQVAPHVTLGKLAVGMGRVVGGDSGLEWHVSGPSTVHPEWGTPVWSREIAHCPHWPDCGGHLSRAAGPPLLRRTASWSYALRLGGVSLGA